MSGDEIEMLREQLDDLRISYRQALATIEQVTRERDEARAAEVVLRGDLHDMEQALIRATGQSPRQRHRVDL